MKLPETLEIYIESELNDSALYTQLAKNAPDQESKDILNKMAEDKTQNAKEFQIIYNGITNKKYEPVIINTLRSKSYRENLRNRVVAEGRGYRRYMNHYNRGLGDALLLTSLFNAGTNSNLNSLLLLYLLSKS